MFASAPLAWPPRRRVRTLLAATVCLALGGCATDAPRSDRDLAGVPPQPLAAARAAAERGALTDAAHRYLALARNAPSPARQQLETRAAELLWTSGRASDAARLLAALDKRAPSGAWRAAAALLGAELALARGATAEAIGLLEGAAAGAGPQATNRRLGLLATAYRRAGEPLRAAEQLDALARRLVDPAAQIDTQVALLFTLATLEREALRAAGRETRGRLQGWIEIALLFDDQGRLDAALDGQFRHWRSAHAGHPARPELARAYFAALAGDYAPGTEVAVVLPSAGRFGAAGAAVRDGLNAARAAAGGPRPELRDAAGFDRLAGGGIGLAIGPLEKTDVDALGNHARLAVPTLALNRLSAGATRPDNLYQFALAPEDEASNAAAFLAAAGLRSALLLYPQGPWGDRVAQAFREQWRALGGTIAGEQVYGATPGGFGATIDSLLAGGRGDCLLLVATGADTRPLWRRLDTANVGRLPTIATSHVYDGQPDAARDAALTGLYFVDIPWMIERGARDPLARAVLGETRPSATGALARLFAMGIDAYRLAPRVTAMEAAPGAFVRGATGGLSVDGRGQVRRELTLARFTPAGPARQARIVVPNEARRRPG